MEWRQCDGDAAFGIWMTRKSWEGEGMHEGEGQMSSSKVLRRILFVLFAGALLAGLWMSPPVRSAYEGYRNSRPIQVRITSKELLVDGDPLFPILLDPRNNQLDYPDSAFTGFFLGGLVNRLSEDPRGKVVLEADWATSYALYMIVIRSLREAGKHDLVLRTSGRPDVALPILEPGPVFFVDLSRALDSVYVVIVGRDSVGFHQQKETLPPVAYAASSPGISVDSLIGLLTSIASTPTRSAVMVNLEVSSRNFGKLHDLLGKIREALSRRSDPQGMRLELNVHSWHTRPTKMMCGPDCPGGGCGDSPREEGLWGEEPDSSSGYLDPNAPNRIDSLRALERDSESVRSAHPGRAP